MALEFPNPLLARLKESSLPERCSSDRMSLFELLEVFISTHFHFLINTGKLL